MVFADRVSLVNLHSASDKGLALCFAAVGPATNSTSSPSPSPSPFVHFRFCSPAGPELTDCYLVITDMAMYLTAEVQRSDFPAAKDGTPHPLNRYTTFKVWGGGFALIGTLLAVGPTAQSPTSLHSESCRLIFCVA